MKVSIALMVILAVCSATASVTVIGAVMASVVAGLLANEIDRTSPVVATRLVRLAAHLLPRRTRADMADEWIDQVISEAETGLRPVFAAAQIALVSAPRLAVRMRAGPLVGKYLFALVGATLDIGQADLNQRKRGTLMSAYKAIVRIGALWIAPFVAIIALRRPGAHAPRWLMYAIGTASLLGWNQIISRLPFWEATIAVMVPLTVTFCFFALVFIKQEALLRFASRMLRDTVA